VRVCAVVTWAEGWMYCDAEVVRTAIYALHLSTSYDCVLGFTDIARPCSIDG